MAANPIKQILNGDVRAVASLMSLIEDGDLKARAALRAIYPHTGRAHVIGVTGAAGTGKSSLIDRMTAEYRRLKKSVGILAVDPSSLFSTGALLGDRIRMRDHFLDDGVFIRSFASRGSRGGLAGAVRDAIHVLDAMGKELIFVETIGVGQDQLEIAAWADLVVVVLMPEMGDEVQGMKAGLAEIADLLVVNKTDLAGADKTMGELQTLFGDSDILIMPASALNDEGTQLLVRSIEERRTRSLGNGSYQRKRLDLCRQELLSLLQERVVAELAKRIGEGALERQLKRVVGRQIDPYSAVEELAKKLSLVRRG
ncbi:MAG: methylmalonyl Co-A mutase-associated GTPase MeaB [Deltaproteobacteria bacterium]|nr:methylmalonyl Co-A mutase-associated GTPase MeaB [Deltaproteobacteria bacterium]